MSTFPADGVIVLYDLEFTSWPGFRDKGFKEPGRYPEIIQIGAVKLDAGARYAEIGSFECYVKPRHNPQLNKYIIDLTGITQARIDADGVPFAEALGAFVAFVGEDTVSLYSYGRDGDIIDINRRLNGINGVPTLPPEINLRELFTNAGWIEGHVESARVPDHFGLDLGYADHDALLDVRGVAATLRHLDAVGRL